MATGKRSRPSAAPAAGNVHDEAAGPGPGSTASGMVALHRSRLFDWKPSAVVAIAACPGAPLFAVGYETGSIELWDMLQLVRVQTVVGPSLEVTSLAWARDSVSSSWRTFVAYLDGTLAEVLWRSGMVGHSTDSYGGVVWSLAASPLAVVKPGFSHVLAAACDDGSVRLFGCEGDEAGLVPERVLARLQGRLLTVAWAAGGTCLVVGGSAGSVHILDGVTGREHLRISVTSSTPRPVTVWRVLALPDGTIVTGDSDGAVHMWDGRFGTQLGRFVQHKADVLALAASEDGDTVWAAGVDSQIAMFTRVSNHDHPDSWAYTHYKRPHTHDVRALALLTHGSDRGAVLLSGGVDAQLLAYPAAAFLQEHPTRLCRVPQRPMCAVAPAPARALTASGGASAAVPRLLVAQNDTLDVWQLAGTATTLYGGAVAGGAAPHARSEGEPLELLAGPRHLARVRVKGARLGSAALSPSGAYLAATTPACTRLYLLEAPGRGPAGVAAGEFEAALVAAGPLRVTRLKLSAPADEAAVAVALTDAIMIIARHDGSLVAVQLGGGEAAGKVVARSKAPPAPKAPTAAAKGDGAAAGSGGGAQAWRHYCPTAAQLVVAPEGSRVAAVGSAGIQMYTLPGLSPVGRLLHADSAFTAAAFSADGRLLAAVTSSCQLFVYDCTTEDCRQLDWCLDHADSITAALNRLPGTPTNISFCPTLVAPASNDTAEASAELPYRLVVNSPSGMVHLDLSRPVSDTYLSLASRKLPRSARKVKPELRPQPEDAPENRTINGRVIRTTHPAVWVGHVGPAELLLLEKPWEEVLSSFPPPLFTHRYGT